MFVQIDLLRELPWWSNGEDFILQCRDCGFNPWLGNYVSLAEGQLSPRNAMKRSHTLQLRPMQPKNKIKKY